ncbi:hypothetical protein HanIR_Chr15g0742571 [Helianthus annuus]|nr:hypothetical protein HanIR_Chr15g0742571 [Helianthus annuus]
MKLLISPLGLRHVSESPKDDRMPLDDPTSIPKRDKRSPLYKEGKNNRGHMRKPSLNA